MKYLNPILGSILAFVALNAFGGGCYGLSGAKTVPLEWLEGSPFRSYFIPSLFLMVVVGGACAFTSIILFMRRRIAGKASFFTGSLLVAWIAIQVYYIGYVSWMQPAVFVTGIILVFSSFKLNTP